MRRGEVAAALRQMQANFDEDPDASSIMELGVAFLWLQDYGAAWKHFNNANGERPSYAAIYYGMAGAAKWCLGESDEAVNQWRLGIECEYADDTQLQIPLILYFAGVANPNIYDVRGAKELLENRASAVTVPRWPLPLAEFVLGRIDESQVRPLCYADRHDSPEMQQCETALRHWSTDFFVAVSELDRDNPDGFREGMCRAGKLSWDDFDEHRRVFLGKLWSPELFLARHEGFQA
jgi:tetratricopeptide (TPR) repeat protein